MLKLSSRLKNIFFMNKNHVEIKINSDYITLGQFLKFADIIHSGGDAKRFLSENEVFINDELDVRRGRKLRDGDKVDIKGVTYLISSDVHLKIDS